MIFNPLLSIGIPFRNPGVLLADAVRSVFAQTIQDWELALIDDGSTDESLDLAYQIQDSRVTVLTDGRARGLVSRLNQWIDTARGRYLVRMDADDIMHPTRLATQLNVLEHNHSIDVVDSGAVILDKNRSPVGLCGLDAERTPDLLDVFKYGVVLHPAVMAKRSWFVRNHYSEHYPRAEDRELFIRTWGHAQVSHIPKPLLYYYCAGNVRLQAYLQSYRSERRVIAQYGPRLIGRQRSVWLWGRSICKSLALVSLLTLGAQNVITANAFGPISDLLANEANETLSRIRVQPVPGW